MQNPLTYEQFCDQSDAEGPHVFPFKIEPVTASVCTGMTLRDHFAGLAMQGICSNGPPEAASSDDIAFAAYNMADAMLAARKEPK